jgi:cofilin
MVKSGVLCTDEVVNAFLDQKLKHTKRYLMFKITDDKKFIVLEDSGDCEWNDFALLLPKEECRYATFDFRYDQGGPKEKLVFVTWYVHIYIYMHMYINPVFCI